MVTASWSLQRAHHGEQPYWAVVLLASALGQIGLPGGGFGFGYGSGAGIGDPPLSFAAPAMDGIKNPINVTIPAARISDCLLHPGERLRLQRQARHLSRHQAGLLGRGQSVPSSSGHQQASSRLGQARHQSWCTSRGGPRPRGTPTSCCRRPPRWSATTSAARAATSSSWRWGRRSRRSGRRATISTSSALWRSASASPRPTPRAATRMPGSVISTRIAVTAPAPTPRRCRTSTPSGRPAIWKFPTAIEEYVIFGDFRADPDQHKLRTPSGKIELYSEKIAGFGYDDCPPHPTWIEPWEWLGGKDAKTYPLHLVSSQPRDRLHSQMDCGPVSAGGKIAGREAITINPADAKARGIGARRRCARSQRARLMPCWRHHQRHCQRWCGEPVLRRLVRPGRWQ